MKSFATALASVLLSAGCANVGTETKSSDPKPSTAQQEHKAKFGNWRVNCFYDKVDLLTQCRAETFGKITEYQGDPSQHPTPVLWISWLKGEPEQARSICVFGHDYPVSGVGLQVDDNRPIQIGALNAAGCVLADSFLITELREGRKLVVTFMRWPWGQTKASFNLHKSINSLNELDRLVAEQ